MSDVVGQVAEFDQSGSMFQDQQGQPATEEVKQGVTEEVAQETETTAELPAEQANAEEQPTHMGEDTHTVDPTLLQQEVARATEGLRNEIVDLRRKLASATGNERKIAQEQLIVAQDNLNELTDVNPEDVSLIEKVLRSKGYMTKDEVAQVTYQQVQKQVVDDFLNKYPEFKPENDPDNINWKALTQEYGLYAQPKDPHAIAALLEKARKAISPTVVSDRNLPAQKRAVQVASAGAGGVQRSSSTGKTFTPEHRVMLEQGGWTKEEIKQMEQKLD